MPDSGHSRETSNNTASERELQHRLEMALLREVYARQKLTMVLQAIACTIFIPFSATSPLTHSLEWIFGLIGYSALGFFIQWSFQRTPAKEGHLRFWHILFTAQCVLSGAIWTSSPSISLLTSSQTAISIAITILLTASAVSLGVLSPHRVGMVAYAGCSLLPPTAVLFSLGRPESTHLGLVLASATIAFIAVGNDMHVNLRRQLLAQFALKNALDAADEARQQAESASKAKGQFLATMSHELRTPMNGVLGMLQLVRETTVSPQQRDYLDKMNGAAQSLLTLLNDVLDFSKIEADSLKAQRNPFRMGELLRNLSDVLSGNVRKEQVQIHFEIDPSVPEVLVGDDQLIQQVLVNLAGNALKFTQQGSVHLSVRVLGVTDASAQLRFTVQDTGIGIAAEHLKVIFDAFAQAESSTTRRFGGTGLGLSISKNLVQLMGGELQVESTPQVGSTFWFDLDLVIAPSAPPSLENSKAAPQPGLSAVRHAPAHSRHAPRLSGIRVMLAEDNLLNQQIACELLALEGATVHAVNNGQEALDALLARTAHTDLGIDLVLMDMHMPVMDGLQATRAIRQVDGLHTLPIIAMTANAMVQDRQNCLDAGMNGHIGKPFTIDALVAVIQTQLRTEA